MRNCPNVPVSEEEAADGWYAPDSEENGAALSFDFQQECEDVSLPRTKRTPIDFFEAFFEDRMWEVIVDETNRYARERKLSLGPDAFVQSTHDSYRPHARLNQWRDTTVSELKLWMAHVILMGLVRKPNIEMYWTSDPFTKTPFFGKLMSRDRFTALLANLHVDDDTENPPFVSALPNNGHDPLAKMRSFINMLDRNFLSVYKPERDISIDEGCMPWKGRLRFKQYNPSKPARFHVKLYQVCEASSGYVLGFKTYTGKGSCHSELSSLDNECTTTTKTVLTLLEACNLLDRGHHVYMDNYYTSPELMEELLSRSTLACGTV